MSDKRIAKIYYDAHLFLTQTGELYGYTIQNDGKPHCNKLSVQEKIAFWNGHGVYEKANLTVWEPVSNISGLGQSVEANMCGIKAAELKYFARNIGY